jgi:hypothetical protein
MRALLLALAIAGTPAVASAMASSENLDGHFGVGFQVGSPFALTGKYWLSKQTALQAYIGTFNYHFNGAGVDWVYEFARVRPSGAPVFFGFHVGVGGILGWGDGNCFGTFGNRYCNGVVDNRVALGVRVPVAANMYLEKIPLEIYLELSPVFEVAPDFNGDLLAALGGRFYF